MRHAGPVRLHRRWLALACVSLSALLPLTARAGDPEGDIRAALSAWTAAFNARDAAAVCRLFSQDLRYDARGLPEQNYRDMCDRLHRSLADPDTRYRYTAAINEILVSGDLAVVRLTWRLTTRRTGRPAAHTTEQGMDIFRRQPDGAWRIIRYIAYDLPQPPVAGAAAR